VAADVKLDFTSLLDDLIAASEAAESNEGREKICASSLRVDMLEQIERLQAENIALFPERAIKEYETDTRAPRASTGADDAAPHLQPALEDLFFLDPQSISRELGIDKARRLDELDRARRVFAKRYHPDRVPEEFRERAALRMQIANMLIDDAKRSRR